MRSATRPTDVSDLAWIVGSLKERDAALELLDYDGEAEPRDELGVGFLRDALAEAFFPGITTLQTRAKYFLLVPEMYRVIENRRASRKSAAAQIVELERALLARLKTSSDIAGVIGSRRWTVPQTPSSAIYWTGLHPGASAASLTLGRDTTGGWTAEVPAPTSACRRRM